MFAGSTRYMAPELLLADNPVPTKEGDVYGFGMVGLEVYPNPTHFLEIEHDIQNYCSCLQEKYPSIQLRMTLVLSGGF